MNPIGEKINKIKDDIAALAENCIECNLCVKNCHLLTEIGETPKSLANRKITGKEAYSCSLCELCSAICPKKLRPIALFQQGRRTAIAEKQVNPHDFGYLVPDRPNTNSCYEEYFNVDYSDLKEVKESDYLFFPGCTLHTYCPDLIRSIVDNITANVGPIMFSDDCCGKPLRQLGLDSRSEKYENAVCERIIKSGAKTVIAACTSCYYILRDLLSPHGIEVCTVYEKLGKIKHVDKPTTVMVNDTCPDRFEHIFKTQLEEKLTEAGYTLIPVKNSGKKTRCCGSGGQVSHQRPDLQMALLIEKKDEFEGLGGEVWASPCMGCIMNISQIAGNTKVAHGLNLLLGDETDYGAVKQNAQTMFADPKGLALWTKMENAPDPE